VVQRYSPRQLCSDDDNDCLNVAQSPHVAIRCCRRPSMLGCCHPHRRDVLVIEEIARDHVSPAIHTMVLIAV